MYFKDKNKLPKKKKTTQQQTLYLEGVLFFKAWF